MKKLALFCLLISLFTLTQSLFCMEIESLHFNKEEQRHLGITEENASRSTRETLLAYDRSHRRHHNSRPGLVYASSIGASNIVLGLLLLGLDANEATPDRYGATPLVEAALWGQFDTAALLLALGANISLPTVRGYTPLRSASGTFMPYTRPNNDAYIYSQRLLIAHLFRWWQHVQRKENADTIQQFKTWLQNTSSRQTLKYWFSIIQDPRPNYNVISNLIDWWTEVKKFKVDDASFRAWIAIPGNINRLDGWWDSPDHQRNYPNNYPIPCEKDTDGIWHAVVPNLLQQPTAVATVEKFA